MSWQPEIVSWNITRHCNLKCPHCYLDAASSPGEGELSPKQALVVVDQIAEIMPGAMLVFSGGEPLLRQDLPALVCHAAGCGLVPVLGTNGTLLDEATIGELLARGLAGAGISLDSPTPDYHDTFRGMKGAWRRAVAAMERCQRLGLPFQVQTSLTRENLPQLEEMVGLSSLLGAAAFNLFFLVCTGRGERLADITPKEYEQALLTLVGLQEGFSGMRLRARCAPHFTRLLAERGTSEAELPVGCMAGTSYLRVTSEGEITPCPYLPLVVGDLHHQGLAQVWRASPILEELRQGRWRGRCGVCPFSARCRGCRARAYALSGDYLGEDLWCTYQPIEGHGPLRIAPLPWQDEARQRMELAPGFVRKRVMAYMEDYARQQGYPEVTLEVMDEARRGTFMPEPFAASVFRRHPPKPD